MRVPKVFGTVVSVPHRVPVDNDRTRSRTPLAYDTSMKPPTADLDTDKKPPLSLPFAHFVAGAVLLLVGGGLAGVGPYFLPIQASSAGTLHLLLAGWVGLTIMGAMVLFVPVWSGTRLHSRRLSVTSLWLVFLGVAGTVTVFFTRTYGWFPITTTVLITGYWTFAYTIARSLPPVRRLDITEEHSSPPSAISSWRRRSAGCSRRTSAFAFWTEPSTRLRSCSRT